MGKREVKYYFGRFNLIAQYIETKEKFLYNGLIKGNEINIGNYKWGFYNIEEINFESDKYICGYLVKYNPKKEEEVVDQSSHKLTLEEISDSVKAKSRFFLHIHSGLISFHPISNQISVDQFINNFSKIFMQAHDNFFVNAEIQIISNRFKILKMLDEFSKIQKIYIVLHPSNPSNSEVWKNVDKKMKDLELAKYQEQYDIKHDKSGEEIRKDENIRAKLTMAEDGYGKGEVTGEINNEIKTISTEDNPVTDTAPGDNINVIFVLKSLYNTIQNIFERFDSNENKENN